MCWIDRNKEGKLLPENSVAAAYRCKYSKVLQTAEHKPHNDTPVSQLFMCVFKVCSHIKIDAEGTVLVRLVPPHSLSVDYSNMRLAVCHQALLLHLYRSAMRNLMHCSQENLHM